MRYSKQREVILNCLKENVVHPSAEYIYAKAKEHMPGLSLATVYRNLNSLAGSNIIKKIDGLEGIAHFDHNTHNHYHFICEKCKKIYDIDYEIASGLAQKVEAQTGLQIN